MNVIKDEYWKGYVAYHKGIPKKDCVYSTDSEESISWLQGYDDAQKEKRAKWPWFSKLFWTGIVMILMSFTGLVQGMAEEYPTVVCIAGVIMGLLVIVFRFLTDQPLIPIFRIPESIMRKLNGN